MSAIGLRVGPFEIRDEAAVPGTGSWYVAERTGLTRRQPAQVLVRLLGPAPSSRELAAVQRQFDVLRSLDDARIPTAVALYEGSGALAVDAPTALPLTRVVEARLLGDVPMTPATLLDLALELSEALSHAHQRGHTHGHLHPGVVALSEDGRTWLWGLGDDGARPPFAWLPPERARGEAVSAATDQWSLGALLVALVTGRTPWSPASVEVDPRSGDIEAFVEPVARQWPALGRLVRRMLEPDPALRFPSLHPVRLELLALARRAGGTSDRRSLAAWLDRDAHPRTDPGIDVGAIPIADDAPDQRPARTAPEPAPEPAVRLRVDAIPAEPEPALDDLAPPRIDDAPRAGAGPRVRPRGPLFSEDLAVVRPDAESGDVPHAAMAGEPPPVRPRPSAVVTAGPSPDGDEDHLATEMVEHPTEMAEDWVPTEMVEVQVELDDAVEDLDPAPQAGPTPVAIRLTDETPATLPGDAPEALEPGPEPAYAEEPTPTLPGMDAPEPALAAAPKAVVPVQIEFDEDEPSIAQEPVAASAPEPVALTVEDLMEETGDLVQVDVELDDGDLEPLEAEVAPAPSPPGFDPEPRRTVVPFTDPHFAGPAFVIDEDAPTPRPAPSVAPTPPPRAGAPRWPWDDEVSLDLPEPANDPVVRIAPWVGSAAVACLALLTVFNILV